MKVSHTFSVSGHVTDDQGLVPFAGVVVRLKELQLETKTDETGAFTFESVPAGTYMVTVELENETRELTTTVPNTGEETLCSNIG